MRTENINKRKAKGISRSRANSTISDKNYAEMKRGDYNKKNERKESKTIKNINWRRF